MTSNYNYWDVDHSPDGEFLVSADENGYARIRNATTGVVIRSIRAFTDDATQVAWFDGTYIAVTTDAQDTVRMYWASNMSNVHGDISADVGSGDEVLDLAFSNDGSMLAIAIGRSGNSEQTALLELSIQLMVLSSTMQIQQVKTGSTA